MKRFALAALLCILIPSTAHAGWFKFGRHRGPRVNFQFSVTASADVSLGAYGKSPAYQPTAAVVQPGNQDYGSLLNATRAQYGRGPLTHDPNLDGLAATNNQHQRARGMGHYYMDGQYGQCAAYGSVTTEGVHAQWVNSPPHFNLLVGNYTSYGIAFDGYYWTLSFR